MKKSKPSTSCVVVVLALAACQPATNASDPSSPVISELDQPCGNVEYGMLGGKLTREESDGSVTPVAGASFSLFDASWTSSGPFLSDDAVSHEDGRYVLHTPLRGHGFMKVSVDDVSYDLLPEMAFDCHVYKHDWRLKRAAAGDGFEAVEVPAS